VCIDNDLIYTGFSNGILVALRKTGTVAWSTSFKGDAERFNGVDATPIIIGDPCSRRRPPARVRARQGDGPQSAGACLLGCLAAELAGNVGGMPPTASCWFVSVATWHVRDRPRRNVGVAGRAKGAARPARRWCGTSC